jgi:hypothetical protein
MSTTTTLPSTFAHKIHSSIIRCRAIVALLVTFSAPTNAAFLKCPGAKRCGLFSVTMNNGGSGSLCREYCVLFPFLKRKLQCGSCAASGKFSIDLQFLNFPQSDQVYFERAKARWEEVVAGDLAGVKTLDLPKLSDGFERCDFPATVDDLYICARYENLPAEVGAFGGPIYMRLATDNTAVIGNMTINTLYVEESKSTGYLDTMILHEMGHILGK